jgi:hypothetical protein
MIIGAMSEGGFEFRHPTFPCIILKTQVEWRAISPTWTWLARYGLIMAK